MKLAFITDEATQDFSEAVAMAKDWGLQGLELRSVNDMPIDQISPELLRQWRRRLDGEGLSVCNLASSFYKCGLGEGQREELEKLSRLCDAADILGCGTIRGFSFFSPEGERVSAERLAPFFDRPGRLLRERGKKLLLEADPGVNTTNHQGLAELLKLLDKEAFGAIYDPGNDIYDPFQENPFPEGYEAIRPYLAHVHIKDAVLSEEGPLCVKPGTGLVDYGGLLRALAQDGYDGWLSLEPHYRKNVVLTEEQMRLPQGRDFSQGGRDTLKESAEALKAMLEAYGGIGGAGRAVQTS